MARARSSKNPWAQRTAGFRGLYHEWLSGNALEGASWESFADRHLAFTKRLGKRRSRKLGQRIGYREVGLCQASERSENGIPRYALCCATERRIELSVPTRSAWCAGIAMR